MVQLWIVDITLEDGTYFEKAYVARSGEEANQKAIQEYPTWVSVGARQERF